MINTDKTVGNKIMATATEIKTAAIPPIPTENNTLILNKSKALKLISTASRKTLICQLSV